MLAKVLLRLAVWWGLHVVGRYSLRALKWGAIKLLQHWKARRQARKVASFRKPRVPRATKRTRCCRILQRLRPSKPATPATPSVEIPPAAPTTRTGKGFFGRFRRKLTTAVVGKVVDKAVDKVVDRGRRILEPPVARALQTTFDFVGLTLEVQRGR